MIAVPLGTVAHRALVHSVSTRYDQGVKTSCGLLLGILGGAHTRDQDEMVTCLWCVCRTNRGLLSIELAGGQDAG